MCILWVCVGERLTLRLEGIVKIRDTWVLPGPLYHMQITIKSVVQPSFGGFGSRFFSIAVMLNWKTWELLGTSEYLILCWTLGQKNIKHKRNWILEIGKERRCWNCSLKGKVKDGDSSKVKLKDGDRKKLYSLSNFDRNADWVEKKNYLSLILELLCWLGEGRKGWRMGERRERGLCFIVNYCCRPSWAFQNEHATGEKKLLRGWCWEKRCWNLTWKQGRWLRSD